VKRQLANSSADTLVEITEVYLAYMQALKTVSPESCVALSDDSKGANLTVNLAQRLPVLFGREMAVLERVASVDPGTAVAAPTADQAQQYINTVYTQLRKLPVQSELLNSNTLTESQFQPYCAVVVAFYQAVLKLPRDDKINLLRYLYAAAIEPNPSRSPPESGSKSVRGETALTQAEMAALRRQLSACWQPPDPVLQAKGLVVTVRFSLNRDGSLVGEPVVVNRENGYLFQVAAESATRAVRSCQPFRLPIAKYEAWRELESNFSPEVKLGG
jgi:hypothetical protein